MSARPRESGAQRLPIVPPKDWIPASAGMSGVGRSN
jgi:hypothetical protein